MLKTLPSSPSSLAEPPIFPLAQAATVDPLRPVVGDELDDTAEDSLFERFAWLYIFCREKLFRDDTERMIRALWPNGKPAAGEKVIELGCGPGFYSCNLAERFREISVIGIDQSPSQLKWAREKRNELGLNHCRFRSDNVLELSHPAGSFDVMIASRLFTVLPNRRRAVAEMFRVLRPGGRCFIAEPRYAFWASIPLFTMWVLAGLTNFKNGYREPSRAKVLSLREMNRLFASQPWRKMETWTDGRYQYALCEKG
ncbi:MAG TPA: class I SAM-dependent methyltransferase [Chthoniobacterales bacterium]|nr:class I SAM-dependent methyltransferase [Chthoniobacterales bacterium]